MKLPDFHEPCPERLRLLRAYVNAVLSVTDITERHPLPHAVDGQSTRTRAEDAWRDYETHVLRHRCREGLVS
jgi:hypothetical protein